MKHHWKRSLAVMMSGLFAVSLASCGKSGGGSGADSKEFIIGGIGPLTGPAAQYGIAVKNAAEIAVDEINEAGGVNGMKFKLIFEDDEAREDKAQTAFNNLLDKHVNAILGSVTSGSCSVVVDLTKKENLLQITPSATAADSVKNDNAFRICFTDPIQGQKMADFMVKNKGLKKIGVLYNVSDDYSKGTKDAFVKQVKADGGVVVAEEGFEDKATDFNTQLTNIKSKNPDAIFVPAYYREAAFILTQAHKLGIKVPFFGSDGWDGVLSQLDDKSLAEGAIFLTAFNPYSDSPAAKSFTEKYEKKYKEIPNQFGADAYDAVYAFKAALEKAKSTKSADLIKAMTEIEVNGLTGKMTWDKDGEPHKDAAFVEIKGGKYVDIK